MERNADLRLVHEGQPCESTRVVPCTVVLRALSASIEGTERPDLSSLLHDSHTHDRKGTHG